MKLSPRGSRGRCHIWGKLMKNLFLIICVTLLAGSAFAQLDPDDDGIGVYFNPCACNNCIAFDIGEHRAFLVITHPTSPLGVWGWECKMTTDGPLILSSVEPTGQAINIGIPPEYVVGTVDPQINPYTYPAIVVAIIDFYIWSVDDPIHFYIDAIQRHSHPEPVPAYLDGGDMMIIKKLQQSTGGPEYPVATINGDCAVPEEKETWGGVKALFR